MSRRKVLVVGGAGGFSFDVPIALPGISRLVHYRGWPMPVVEVPEPHQFSRRPPL